jgi:sec-independent protein translocase protein TatA
MFGDIGAPEIILILVIIMIFFGVGKLPEVGQSLGKAINNFKKAQIEDNDKKEEPVLIKASPTKNSTNKKP